MERKKTQRLGLLRYEKLDLRYCVMSTFWEQLQDAFIRGLPSARDFASFPAIKALLDAPDDVEVTIDDFTALRDNVPEYVAEFQRHQKLAIQELIEKELDIKIPPDVDVYKLAIATVICCQCYTSLVDEVCPYGCFNEECSNDEDIDWSAPDACESALNSIAGCHPWSLLPEGLKERRWPLLLYLIDCVGEDPARVTVAEMEQKTTRWICNGPCKSNNARMIMGWRAVVR